MADWNQLRGDSVRHFFRLWSRVERREPTTIVRYADGEEGLIQGTGASCDAQCYVEDGWYAEPGETRLGRDLARTLHRQDARFFYGIPGRNDLCDGSRLAARISAAPEQITFANLFGNLNYRTFLDRLARLEEKVVVLASKRGHGRSFAPLRVHEFVPMEADCVRHWETQAVDELIRAVGLAQHYERTLFLVAAGPMANVLIDAMFAVNPDNRYLDVGSALDEIVQGRVSRPYMDASSEFAMHVSRF